MSRINMGQRVLTARTADGREGIIIQKDGKFFIIPMEAPGVGSNSRLRALLVRDSTQTVGEASSSGTSVGAGFVSQREPMAPYRQSTAHPRLGYYSSTQPHPYHQQTPPPNHTLHHTSASYQGTSLWGSQGIAPSYSGITSANPFCRPTSYSSNTTSLPATPSVVSTSLSRNYSFPKTVHSATSPDEIMSRRMELVQQLISQSEHMQQRQLPSGVALDWDSFPRIGEVQSVSSPPTTEKRSNFSVAELAQEIFSGKFDHLLKPAQTSEASSMSSNVGRSPQVPNSHTPYYQATPTLPHQPTFTNVVNKTPYCSGLQQVVQTRTPSLDTRTSEEKETPSIPAYQEHNVFDRARSQVLSSTPRPNDQMTVYPRSTGALGTTHQPRNTTGSNADIVTSRDSVLNRGNAASTTPGVLLSPIRSDDNSSGQSCSVEPQQGHVHVQRFPTMGKKIDYVEEKDEDGDDVEIVVVTTDDDQRGPVEVIDVDGYFPSDSYPVNVKKESEAQNPSDVAAFPVVVRRKNSNLTEAEELRALQELRSIAGNLDIDESSQNVEPSEEQREISSERDIKKEPSNEETISLQEAVISFARSEAGEKSKDAFGQDVNSLIAHENVVVEAEGVQSRGEFAGDIPLEDAMKRLTETESNFVTTVVEQAGNSERSSQDETSEETHHLQKRPESLRKEEATFNITLDTAKENKTEDLSAEEKRTHGVSLETSKSFVVQNRSESHQRVETKSSSTTTTSNYVIERRVTRDHLSGVNFDTCPPDEPSKQSLVTDSSLNKYKSSSNNGPHQNEPVSPEYLPSIGSPEALSVLTATHDNPKENAEGDVVHVKGADIQTKEKGKPNPVIDWEGNHESYHVVKKFSNEEESKESTAPNTSINAVVQSYRNNDTDNGADLTSTAAVVNQSAELDVQDDKHRTKDMECSELVCNRSEKEAASGANNVADDGSEFFQNSTEPVHGRMESEERQKATIVYQVQREKNGTDYSTENKDTFKDLEEGEIVDEEAECVFTDEGATESVKSTREKETLCSRRSEHHREAGKKEHRKIPAKRERSRSPETRPFKRRKEDKHQKERSKSQTKAREKEKHKHHSSFKHNCSSAKEKSSTRKCSTAKERSPKHNCSPAKERSPKHSYSPAKERSTKHNCSPAIEISPKHICSPAKEKSSTRKCSQAKERSPKHSYSPPNEISPKHICSPAIEKSSTRKCSQAKERSPEHSCSPANERSPKHSYSPAKEISPKPVCTQAKESSRKPEARSVGAKHDPRVQQSSSQCSNARHREGRSQEKKEKQFIYPPLHTVSYNHNLKRRKDETRSKSNNVVGKSNTTVQGHRSPSDQVKMKSSPKVNLSRENKPSNDASHCSPKNKRFCLKDEERLKEKDEMLNFLNGLLDPPSKRTSNNLTIKNENHDKDAAKRKSDKDRKIEGTRKRKRLVKEEDGPVQKGAKLELLIEELKRVVKKEESYLKAKDEYETEVKDIVKNEHLGKTEDKKNTGMEGTQINIKKEIADMKKETTGFKREQHVVKNDVKEEKPVKKRKARKSANGGSWRIATSRMEKKKLVENPVPNPPAPRDSLSNASARRPPVPPTSAIRPSACNPSAPESSASLLSAPRPSMPRTTATRPSVSPTTAPRPSVSPTTAPRPSVSPTTAPRPSVPPTTAPRPSVPPTTAPRPSVSPTKAPRPSVSPTTASRPSVPRTTATRPSVPPTTAPRPSVSPTTATRPSVPPTTAPRPSVSPTTAPRPSVLATAAPRPSVSPTTAPRPSVSPTTAPRPSVSPTTAPRPSVSHTTAPRPSVPHTTAPRPSVPPTTATRPSVPPTTAPRPSVPPTTAPRPSVPPTTAPRPSVPPTTAPRPSVPPTTAPRPSVPPTTAPRPSVPPTTAPRPSVPPTTAPRPSVPPTTAPRPSVPPTTAPRPSVPPTTATRPSVPPTTAPRPSVPPTTAPRPSVPPTTAPRPSVPPTTAPRPSVPPTTAPRPSVPPTTATRPSVPPTVVPRPSVPPTAAPRPSVSPTVVPRPSESPLSAPRPSVVSTKVPRPSVPLATAPRPSVPPTTAPRPSVLATAATRPSLGNTSAPGSSASHTSTPRPSMPPTTAPCLTACNPSTSSQSVPPTSMPRPLLGDPLARRSSSCNPPTPQPRLSAPRPSFGGTASAGKRHDVPCSVQVPSRAVRPVTPASPEGQARPLVAVNHMPVIHAKSTRGNMFSRILQRFSPESGNKNNMDTS